MTGTEPQAARFAVVGCSGCGRPWAVELRHERSACPDCHTRVDVAGRTRLWQGDDARQAQAAVAHHRAALAGGLHVVQAPRRPAARHDSATDAAAAKAAGIVNASARAEAVALWRTRLSGLVPHEELVVAMGKAGIAAARAEREVVRLLATDLMLEPRAGHYRFMEP
jgi:DNA-directed RNA polymerase subunit RPC12/RpoP